MAPPAKEKFPCLDCKKNVTEKQACVQCSICDRWQHKDCGIDEDVFQLIQKIHKKSGHHFWSCEGCSTGLNKLQKMVNINREQIATLKEDVSVLKTDQESQSADIEANKSDIVTLKQDLKEIQKKSTDNSCETLIEEFEQRDAKKSNIIIFALDEQDQSLDSVEKKKLDTNKVADIFSVMKCSIDIKKDVKFVSRIGVYDDEKVRPLTIGFYNEEKKDKVLSCTWNLAKSTYVHLSISPDLTKVQIAKEKELIAEAKTLNENLSSEEAKNYLWKLVGKKGQRKLRKTEKKKVNIPRGRIGSVRRTREEMEEDSMDEDSNNARKKHC